MAGLLKRELDIDTDLVDGDRGEFSVLVDDRIVVRKGWLGFPGEQKILSAVREALAG